MPTKIGIRVYQTTVSREGTKKRVPFDTEGITVALPDFVKSFRYSKLSDTQSIPRERLNATAGGILTHVRATPPTATKA